MHPNRPRQIGSRYLNEETQIAPAVPTSVATYTQADVAVISVVQETQTINARITSSVSGRNYNLRFFCVFQGQNNGNAQIVNVKFNQLPGFSAGFANFNSSHEYHGFTCGTSGNGPTLQRSQATFVDANTVQFLWGNTNSVQEADFSFSFVN